VSDIGFCVCKLAVAVWTTSAEASNYTDFAKKVCGIAAEFSGRMKSTAQTDVYLSFFMPMHTGDIGFLQCFEAVCWVTGTTSNM